MAAPPIAGFGGVAGTQGLTTQTLYDADLTDSVGLETGGGMTVTNPLGGTYSVSLSAAIAKLGQPLAQTALGPIVFGTVFDVLADYTSQRNSGKTLFALLRAFLEVASLRTWKTIAIHIQRPPRSQS